MKTIISFVLLFTVCTASYAQDQSQEVPQTSLAVKTSVEYLVPTRNGNPIRTCSAHAFFWKKHLKRATFFLKAGVTATYGWGYSRQWYPVKNNLWEAYDYETSAFGIGPVLEFEHPMIETKYFNLMVEASAGCIRYNKHFPYGGDIYDFMLRTGPSLNFHLNKNLAVELGYRWMHISNGKGSGNQNPFYEAQGIVLSFNFRK
jgi:hypothetical protein